MILMKKILKINKKLFKKIKGKPYSINTIDKILDEIDQLQQLNNINLLKLMLRKY
jgi:predicted transcriptional regulator